MKRPHVFEASQNLHFFGFYPIEHHRDSQVESIIHQVHMHKKVICCSSHPSMQRRV